MLPHSSMGIRTRGARNLGFWRSKKSKEAELEEDVKTQEGSGTLGPGLSRKLHWQPAPPDETIVI